MQKAAMPGTINFGSVFIVEAVVAKKGVENTLIHPSQMMLTKANETAEAGDNQNKVDGGLSRPIVLSCMATCVTLQRRPPQTLANMTSENPDQTNAVSEATINSTPPKIIKITMTRCMENASSRNRNAKKRTNISEEDLHMAARVRGHLTIRAVLRPREHRR